MTLTEVLTKAVEGGTSGALAMTVQVTSLMWMRTTMNYQYRYGSTTTQAMKTLWNNGGVARFYRGIGPALLQGPLSRFGDTAANVGVLALLEPYNLPIALKTGCSSFTAGIWRICIMPIDTLKTTMQVEGSNGLRQLGSKIGTRGPFILFHGAIAASVATIVGHFPWFYTFNLLQKHIPVPQNRLSSMARNGFIGFTASVVSDSVSNSLRVIKTTRQTFPEVVSYREVVRRVLEQDGLKGLLGRGLKTRLLANGLQGLMFSVLWKYFMEMSQKRHN